MSTASLVAVVHAASQVASVAPKTGSQVSDWLAPGSLSFELVKGMPAAFVALIIGLIAAGIAYRQYQIARAKLKLDLFEHRYELYMVLWVFLSEGTTVPSPNNGPEVRHFRELHAKYFNAIPRAYFLFGQEIGQFFDLVGEKIREHNLALRRLHQLPAEGPDRRTVEETIISLEQWATDTRIALKARFGDYMSFEQWRR